MPEMIVRCPGCSARMKVPPAAQAKESVRCPKCKGPVPLRPPAPPVEEVQEVLPAEEEFDELEEVAPAPARAKRRPPPEDEEDDEDDRPARRGRRRDEEDEEDDRPRGRGRRARGKTEGPWLIALAVAPGAFLLAFLGCLLIMGTAGLPEAEEGGPVAKFFGLGLMLVVCGVLVIFGVLGVKTRHTYGRWGIEIKGDTAVWVGMIQTFFGGLLAGMAVYGLLFEVYHLLFG